MITNPSTLGLFEARIGELLDAVHAAGALAYMDGANLNAILGRFKPGEAGFDVMHFNVHKTFCTPHGGGGPGAGPVGVGEKLLPFLPAPRVLRERRRHVPPRADRASGRPRSAGCAASSATPASSCARTPTSAPTAATGLREVSDDAVLAANYLKDRLAGHATTSRTTGPASTSSSPRPRRSRSETGVRTLDIAKRLIDHGFHPPTIYFPLIVEEGMLIEPTETESVETLDAFADALIAIAAEAATRPGAGHGGAAHGPGPAPRRGDRRPPAEPALAPDDRRPDALSGLTGRRLPRAVRTFVRSG